MLFTDIPIINKHILNRLTNQFDCIYYQKDVSSLLSQYSNIVRSWYTDFFNSEIVDTASHEHQVLVDFVKVANAYIPGFCRADGGRDPHAPVSKCSKCDSQLDTHSEYSSCPKCNLMVFDNENVFIDSSFDGNANIIKRQMYRESVHFSRLFDLYTGLKSVPLSEALYKTFSEKLHFFNWGVITTHTIRRVLEHMRKRCRITNISNNSIPWLYHEINGVYPLGHIQHLRPDFKTEFKLVLRQWQAIPRSSNRTSFLSYPFVLYKILIKLGFTSESVTIPLFKHFDNLKEHEMMWTNLQKLSDI
jgi:hypothetical protein